MIAAEHAPGASAVVGSAPADAEALATSSSTQLLQSRLERLQELDGSALRGEWRRLFRSEPPRISRDLLTRALAYRLQELEFGGLPKWARQRLAGSPAAADSVEANGVTSAKPAPPRLKPGSRLIREWHGRMHSVVVLEGAFEFEGKRYRSLTQIAREITGAHWSGPRFFGLLKRRAGSDPGASLTQDTGEEARGLAPPARAAPSVETQDDFAGVEGEGDCRSELQAGESAHA